MAGGPTEVGGPGTPHQLPVSRGPVGHEAVHLALECDRRQRIFEQASRKQPHQLRDCCARRPSVGRPGHWEANWGRERNSYGDAVLPTSKVTRGEAVAAGVLSRALGLSWLPASPVKGSASAGPRSRHLFSPSVSGTRRCLFRLMSRDLVELGNG